MNQTSSKWLLGLTFPATNALWPAAGKSNPDSANANENSNTRATPREHGTRALQGQTSPRNSFITPQ
ncbi:Hypothetical predicted protein [Marmota monax]|uniref:Uncharacterized protein n=1 Tax=Marmota monax TaxID=9995 RepID=A0A5E4D522_MARMO|nr:hypothetical protein GHT09_017086 [Marmota monax]VTJ89096.1 Hypothetical predicted protein [Marmota monax]